MCKSGFDESYSRDLKAFILECLKFDNWIEQWFLSGKSAIRIALDFEWFYRLIAS